MKHSPTPWRWDADTNGEDYRLRDASGVIIINHDTWDIPTNPDAALIAAAPDLLEACKGLVEKFVPRHIYDQRRLDKAIAAIAKAEGTNKET